MFTIHSILGKQEKTDSPVEPQAGVVCWQLGRFAPREEWTQGRARARRVGTREGRQFHRTREAPLTSSVDFPCPFRNLPEGQI